MKPFGALTVQVNWRIVVLHSGFEDRDQGYQVAHLYVIHRDGSESFMFAPKLDRDLNGGVRGKDGTGLYAESRQRVGWPFDRPAVWRYRV